MAKIIGCTPTFHLFFDIIEDFSQQFLSQFHLLQLHAAQRLHQRLVGNRPCRLLQRPPILGQIDQVDASVALVRDAHHQVLPLHGVNQSGHARLILKRGIAELLLRHPILIPQKEQDGPLLRGDVDALQPEVLRQLAVDGERNLAIQYGKDHADVDVELLHATTLGPFAVQR